MIAPRRLRHLPAVARRTFPNRGKPARRAAVAASLLFHALVLAVLGWRAAPRLALREEVLRPDVELTLVRPLPSTAASRTQAHAAAGGAPALAPVQAQPRASSAARAPSSLPTSAAAPPPAAAPAPPSGVGAQPGPLPGAEAGGDLRGFLRAGVGCAHRDGVGLTHAEREACDQKAGEVARAAPGGLLIPDDKLAGYAKQAETDARKRGLREGPLLQPFIPCPAAQAGSNLGLGCLPKEASHTVLRF